MAPIDSDRLARGVDALAPGVGAKLLAWVRGGNETAAVGDALAAIGLQLACKDAPPRTVAGFAAERDGDGLRVVAVGDGGPAELGGLKPGDRIVTLDGAAPTARWPDAVAHAAPGASLVLGVLRAQRRLELRLTLASDRDTTCKLTQAPATPAVTRLREELLSP